MTLKSSFKNFLFFSLTALTGCNNNENFNSSKNFTDLETQQMVEVLKKINSDSNPTKYLHWNNKRAQYLKKLLPNSPKKLKYMIWSSYCNELLLGGRNIECIKEIEGKFVESEKSRLFINNGNETFTESSIDFNIDISMYAMGSNFGDIDNDGWLDFYIGNGSPELTSNIPNRMFRNFDGKRFNEVTLTGRFGHIQKGHGVGFADLDNDGDQDLNAVMGGAYEGDTYPSICFENPNSKNNWVVFKLIGKSSNRSAIGSFLTIELDNGRKIYRTINTGGSFGSSSLQSEIGLGKSKSIKKLSINWPSGKNQVFTNIEPNKKYEVLENKRALNEIPFNKLNFSKKKSSSLSSNSAMI